MAGELANTGPAKVANADAVALTSYLFALGIEASADRVNKLLVLLAVLVIECGGGLALAVGMALGEGRPTVRADGKGDQPGRTLSSDGTTEQPDASPVRTPRKPTRTMASRLHPAVTERPHDPRTNGSWMRCGRKVFCSAVRER